MYALATCTATVLRGTTANEFLDVVDTDTSVATGVLAAIRRTSKAIRAQVQSDVDLRVGDRLRDDTHGPTYVVQSVTTPGGPGVAGDLEVELTD